MLIRKGLILEGLSDFPAVIVADDDAVIRSLLRSKLESIDQIVFLASNGVEAVDLASRMQPKLILLDLKMPRLDGLRACQRIRQMPHNAKTPIVILTAIIGKDPEAAARRVGATAFLAKPFRSAHLLRALAGFLDISEETRAVINQAADRAAGVVRTTSASKVTTPETQAKENSLLDRGKGILTVLRN
jgi:CheY-like chemotaxis protein